MLYFLGKDETKKSHLFNIQFLMNILNLLTKEKRVAGIEISDSVVRIAFLRPLKKTRGDKVLSPNTSSIQKDELILIEEPIPANIIVQGVVVDKVLLGKTLKSIWIKAKLNTDYAIVAIPDDKIYSRVFSFPKTIGGTRLTEAMNLAIGFQLPMKTEDTYLDWESTQGTVLTNEILLSTIPRGVANGYVEALDMAGIKTLAVESQLASIARAIKLKPDRTVIFTKKTPDGATVFVLKDGILRFSRTFPLQFISEDKIPAEVEKIKSALEVVAKWHSNNDANKHEQVDVLDLHLVAIRDDYANYPELSDSKETKFKWHVALGAVIRGQIPEGADNLISLLPVGTEEAYAYQKATTFVTLIRNMTVGVSVFFIFAFLATYLFMLSLSQDSSRTIATLSASAVSPDLLLKEEWLGKVNSLTSTAVAILDQTPLWSMVIDEVNSRIIDGITISSFSAPSVTEKMSLVGIAKDRATLSQFKKLFQESAMWTEVDIPPVSLSQRENLSFSISFRLKDPSAVYLK